MSVENDKVIKAATKLKSLELEIGGMVLPLLSDYQEVDRLARLANVKTGYLIELAMIAGGLKKPHRGFKKKRAELKKTAA